MIVQNIGYYLHYNNNGYSEEDPKTCDNFLTVETLLTMHLDVYDKVMSD